MKKFRSFHIATSLKTKNLISNTGRKLTWAV